MAAALIEISESGMTWCRLCGRACGAGSQCPCSELVMCSSETENISTAELPDDPRSDQALTEFYSDQKPLELEPEPDHEHEAEQDPKDEAKHEVEREPDREPKCERGAEDGSQLIRPFPPITMTQDTVESSPLQCGEESTSHKFSLTVITGTCSDGSATREFALSSGGRAVLYVDEKEITVSMEPTMKKGGINVSIFCGDPNLRIKLDISPACRDDVFRSPDAAGRAGDVLTTGRKELKRKRQ